MDSYRTGASAGVTENSVTLIQKKYPEVLTLVLKNMIWNPDFLSYSCRKGWAREGDFELC